VTGDDDGGDTEEFDRPTASWYGEHRLAAAHGIEKTRSEMVRETHRTEMGLLRVYAVHLSEHPRSPLNHREPAELMELSGYDHRELRPGIERLQDRLPEGQQLTDFIGSDEIAAAAAETEVDDHA